MLKAARAHGKPMMVIAMMIAATTQPAAIHTPPSNNHRMFRNIETGCMSPLQDADALRRTITCIEDADREDSKEEAGPE
jgi:hypothetical protein